MPTRAGEKYKITFFINISVNPSAMTGPTPVSWRLSSLRPILNGYHSLDARGMPEKRKCVVTNQDPFDAYCYVERQFNQAAGRPSPDLAQGLRARHCLPAGNQM